MALRLLLVLVLWTAAATQGWAAPTKVVVTADPALSREAAQITRVANATLARIAADLPTLSPPTSIEVRLVLDTSQLDDVAPPGRRVPTWAVGVSFPGTNIVAVALNRRGENLNYLSTTAHELAHAALDSALGEYAPHWLHEGFAALYSTNDNWEHMSTLAGIAWFHNATPLGELDATFRAHHVTAGRAYAQSYDFVKYLAERGRYADLEDDGDPWPFRRFVAALAAGTDGDQAAMAQFGAPLSVLFEQWQESLTTRYFLVPVALLSTLFWVIVAGLLVWAWWRKRRLARRVLASWAAQEHREEQELAAQLQADTSGDAPLRGPLEPELLLGGADERHAQVGKEPLQ